MAETIQVEGLRELNRAFAVAEKELQKELRSGLKKAAEPVAEVARGKAARFGGNVARGIAAGSRAGGAVVRQRNKRVSGLRPDFGVLQMRTVLEPALAEQQDAVVRAVEQVLDSVIAKAGF